MLQIKSGGQLGLSEFVSKHMWPLDKSWKTSELHSWLSGDLILQVFSKWMGSPLLERGLRGWGLASQKIAQKAQDSLK